MAGYIGSRASVVSSGAERKKTFDITGTTTSLTGLSYTPTFVHLFHNGVRLVDGTDYTATNGTSITLTTAAQSGDQVVVVSYATFQAADAYTKAEADDAFVNDPNSVISVSGSNVGIGTDLPTFTSAYGGLHVHSTYPEIHLTGTDSGSGASDGFKIQKNSANHVYLWNYENAFMAFGTNNSERLRIDSSGRVTMPYQPYFSATCSGSSAYTTFGAGVALPFNSTARNTGSHFNTSNYRFTAPITGKYAFSAGVITDNANPVGRMMFYVNGNTNYDNIKFGISGSNTAGGGSTNTSAIIHLNANDYVDVRSQSGNIIAYTDGGHSSFTGVLIG